jgi:hypothetical protein
MGSALNVGYGLQWPLFAVFFGVMWWRMLRMEAARLADEPVADVEPEPAPVAPVRNVPDGPSPFGPRPAAGTQRLDDDDPDDRRLASYNQRLAEIAERDAVRERR